MKTKTIERFDEDSIAKLFGSEAAEDEEISRLKEYYIKNTTHEKVTADQPLRILVGHKGVGKSAIFKVSMAEDISNRRLPILIKPDDIAELGKDTSDVLQTIRDWKNGLIQIIAKKTLEYAGINEEISQLKTAFKATGRIVNYITDTFKSVQNNINLLPTQKNAINIFLGSSKINVYIDDLDRGWQSKKDDINRISALLNAVRDLSNENSGLHFKISLRSDVYYLVRTSDESTDKIEGSVIWHKWTNHEILLLLIKRIETYFGENFDIEKFKKQEQRQLSFYLDAVFEKRFTHYGKWENAPMYRILMSLIRKRPRDLVKLCSLAARYAQDNNLNKINTECLIAVFEEYSQGRIQDSINEFRSELPDIERLLFGMKPNKSEIKEGNGYIYSTESLKIKINNLITQGKFSFSTGRPANAGELSHFLYKINFVTARKRTDTGEIDRKYFEENRYLSSSKANFGYDWEIHPAFRWALQPDRIEDIFVKLDLSSDS